MSKTKILFRIKSLLLFIGFFFSCKDCELGVPSTNEVLPETDHGIIKILVDMGCKYSIN